MAARVPSAEVRPPFRLKKALGVGVTLNAGQVGYEIVRVFNSVNARVRIKATQACTLDLIPLGPDVDQDFTGAVAAVGTQYATGGNLAVAVAAATEVKSDLALMGEGYILVKVTMGGTQGQITFVDICQLAYTR